MSARRALALLNSPRVFYIEASDLGDLRARAKIHLEMNTPGPPFAYVWLSSCQRGGDLT